MSKIFLLISVCILLFSQSVLIFVNDPTYSITPTCANYNANTKWITVVCNTNLSEINRIVNNGNILEKDSNGVWILKASIIVDPYAKITINHNDTSWLKIINNKDGKPNFISIFGSANIDNVKITSWDPLYNRTIKQNVNGSILRPYIVINKPSGVVNITNSEVASLGSNHYPLNGLVFTNITNKSNIINNSFHDMWDGFYSDAAGFITIKDNKYYDNLRYGIDPHSGSHDLNITGNTAYKNSQIGIICSENCYNILFNNNTIHNNGVAGLMFSLQTNNSTAKNNIIYNEKVGISIFSSSNNKAYENTIKSGNIGVFIGGNSTGNNVYKNTITNTTVGIKFAENQRNNRVDNNRAYNVSSPIQINP